MTLLLRLFSCASALFSVASDASLPQTSTTTLASLPPGDHLVSIRVANDTIIHVPPALPDTPTPLVLALHGLGENDPANFQREISMDDVADKEGFITVYPLGSPSVSTTMFGHTWNGGKCCFSDKDDFSFLLSVVKQTSQLVSVDASRVYVFGFSAGGVMSHRLGCEAASVFAAFASVDGPIEVSSPCAPSRPVPVLHFHGLLDEVFPYHGDVLFNGATQTFQAWKQTDACGDNQTNSTLDPRATTSEYTQCSGDARVELVSIKGGLHAWPPKEVNAEQYIWDFLSKFHLN